MTSTEKLKHYIERKYASVREFTIAIDMPYTTLHSIFKRGIENSSVSNITKICDALNISIQDLINNEIKPCSATISNNNESVIEIAETLLSHKFTLSNGKKLNSNEIKDILKIIEYSLIPDI